MNLKIAQTTAKMLLEIKAISIRPKNPFVFTSGILSPIYIDNRIVMSRPKTRKKIISFYLNILKNKIGLSNIDLLSGTATAAIPHAAFISQKLNLPMIYVRGKKKGHGKENQVEGLIKKGQKVVVIEDHISTGGSLIGNLRAVRKAGGKVKYAVSTTTFLFKKADNAFKKEKIKVFTLTNFKEIIEIAVKNDIIKASDREMVLEWNQNPKKWGKKYGFE
ncbi:orotate phosphoribosyltransferase [Patescibacteria group bacterium]